VKSRLKVLRELERCLRTSIALGFSVRMVYVIMGAEF
jgi:hypothetical protein